MTIRFLLAFALAAVTTQTPARTLPLDTIKLPPGFSIAMYATGVPNARQMALGDKGTLFVGSRTARKVYAVVDRDGDQKADQAYTIANGLNMPSGLAFRGGSLYVAEVDRVLRYDAIESSSDPRRTRRLHDGFRTERIRLGNHCLRPDGCSRCGGAPGNLQRRAKRFRPNGMKRKHRSEGFQGSQPVVSGTPKKVWVRKGPTIGKHPEK